MHIIVTFFENLRVFAWIYPWTLPEFDNLLVVSIKIVYLFLAFVVKFLYFRNSQNSRGT